MPVIKCKEKEGLEDACGRDIVYLDTNITSLFAPSGGGGTNIEKTEKATKDTVNKKKRYLTLRCTNNHIHNYQIPSN